MVRFILRMALSALAFSAVGCTSVHHLHHTFGPGEVLDVDGRTARIALGSEDRIRVGQEFVTYLSVLLENRTRSVRDDGMPEYRTERTGRVRITEIIDAHHSRAEILEGDVKPGHAARTDK